MPDEALNFDRRSVERIAAAVIEVENLSGSNDPTEPPVWTQYHPKQGKLTEDLDSPEEFGTPARAEMDVYVPDPDAPWKLIEADYAITVTNRDPMLAAAEDDWLRVSFINGEWQPSGRNPCDEVAFEITEADCSAKTATVDITHRTCACSRVPGEYGSDKLDVVDDTCFFIQATDENLVGRKGFAKRMRADAGDCLNEKQTLRISTNEIQDLSIESGTPTTGTFKLTFDDNSTTQTTGALQWNSTAADITTALDGLSNIDSVTCTGGPLPGTAIRIEWTGDAVDKTDYDLMTVSDSTLDVGTATMTAVQDGGASPDSGSFRLTFDDGDTSDTTVALDHNCTAGDVETALEALDNIDDVTVSGGAFPDLDIVVEFDGPELECRDFALMEAVEVSLSPGGSVIITETQAGSPAVICRWVITWLCPINQLCVE